MSVLLSVHRGGVSPQSSRGGGSGPAAGGGSGPAAGGGGSGPAAGGGSGPAAGGGQVQPGGGSVQPGGGVQHLAPSCGRYASCVHAGGLSCLILCSQFDLWTDAQRKKFLAAIFSHCRRSQLIFTQKYFNEHVPLKHLDFTKVIKIRLITEVNISAY